MKKLALFTVITVFAVTGLTAQNKQQIINKSQFFIDVDANNDGFINKDEYQFGSLDEFDTDKNGKLSRNEYINAKRTLNGNTGCNLGLGMNRNRGNCMASQRRNGKFKNSNWGNAQNNGTGVCPYGNQGLNNNSSKTKAQSTP